MFIYSYKYCIQNAILGYPNCITIHYSCIIIHLYPAPGILHIPNFIHSQINITSIYCQFPAMQCSSTFQVYSYIVIFRYINITLNMYLITSLLQCSHSKHCKAGYIYVSKVFPVPGFVIPTPTLAHF